MEQLPQPVVQSASAAAPDPEATPGACPACGAAPAAPRKLDLSGMAAPGDLRATRLEEFTIDGICGVY